MCTVDLVESPQEVFCSSIHIIASRVVGKVIDQRRFAELLSEQINLVEEEDDARSHKPSRVDNRVEKDQAFHHAILITCFKKHLIVFAERYAEDDGRDIFKAMNPLFAFASLSTHVKHAVLLSAMDLEQKCVCVEALTVCSIDPSESGSRIYRWSLS